MRWGGCRKRSEGRSKETKKYKSTPWAMVTIKGLAIRDLFHKALAGEDISGIVDSNVWGNQDISEKAMVQAL